MRCSADIGIKDCSNQKCCCDFCGYEDCMEGCNAYETNGNGCVDCRFATKKVIEEIQEYSLEKLAIYLHSFQIENYTVREIEDLLNEDITNYQK